MDKNSYSHVFNHDIFSSSKYNCKKSTRTDEKLCSSPLLRNWSTTSKTNKIFLISQSFSNQFNESQRQAKKQKLASCYILIIFLTLLIVIERLQMPTFGSAQQQCKKRESGKFEGRIFRLVMILLIAISF